MSPQAPRYDAGGLAAVLPAVTASLDVPALPGAAIGPELDPARRAVVVLVDGMGLDALTDRVGHAPYLRSLLPSARPLSAGFPSTTAVSMGTFGTGRAPGQHGLVGYEVLDPEADRVFNLLSWQDGPDPLRWQPAPTVFEHAHAHGVAVTRVGPGYFDGSGLTQASVRGGDFRAGLSLAERVDLSVAALRAHARALVFLYWGDLDKLGHQHGCQSWQWGQELEAVDAELARLVAMTPAGTAVHITADHGMVDVPFEDRIDLAQDAELAAGLRHVGGEARARLLYCEPGAQADVAAAWRGRLGDRAWVRLADEAIEAGWFGPVRPQVRDRIGDVVVAMRDAVAVVDSRRDRPQLLSLLGLHGSLTGAEVRVPWLTARAG